MRVDPRRRTGASQQQEVIPQLDLGLTTMAERKLATRTALLQSRLAELKKKAKQITLQLRQGEPKQESLFNKSSYKKEKRLVSNMRKKLRISKHRLALHS